MFEDGLDIQKQRIRELREYAKEKREALAQRQQDDIESLENLYPLLLSPSVGVTSFLVSVVDLVSYMTSLFTALEIPRTVTQSFFEEIA